MSVTVQSGSTLAFDRFWRWLKQHPNCVLRAGTSDVWLYDQEDLHWHLDEDPDRNPTVQLVQGKQLVGEIVLDVRDALFVQATPEGDAADGHFLFEVVGGGREEPYPVYHFLVAHGLDEEAGHAGVGLKH
jgi:hypothetical protein